MACFLVATLVLVPSLQVQSLGSIHTSLIMCHVLLNGCHLHRVTSTSVVHKHMSKQYHLYVTLVQTKYQAIYIVLGLLSCMAGCCHSEWTKTFEGENFRDFMVLWLFANVFSMKFGSVASLAQAQASNLRKSSPRKSYFSPVHESFLPRKFPAIRYYCQLLPASSHVAGCREVECMSNIVYPRLPNSILAP